MGEVDPAAGGEEVRRRRWPSPCHGKILLQSTVQENSGDGGERSLGGGGGKRWGGEKSSGTGALKTP